MKALAFHLSGSYGPVPGQYGDNYPSANLSGTITEGE
jgi:hypothetical protein